MVRAYPTMPKYAASQGHGWLMKGDLFIERGRPDEALPWYDRAAATARAILAKERDDDEANGLLSDALSGRADALAHLGRLAESLAEWDAASRADPDPTRAELIALGRAASLARCGDHRAAVLSIQAQGEPRFTTEGTAQKARARIYALAASVALADRSLAQASRTELAAALSTDALAALARSRACRWTGDAARLARILSSPDFDALRPRPEFKNLETELSFPANPFAP